METTAVILAAGLGTRMKSNLPKAAHLIVGRSMLGHIIAAAEAAYDTVIVVTGPEMPAITALAVPHQTVIQTERCGTAHAALAAEQKFGDGLTAILYADNPLISTFTLRALRARLLAGDASLVLLATTPPDPGNYGRLIIEQNYVTEIIEAADATPDQLALTLCNAGGMIAKAEDLKRWLAAVTNHNSKGEFYLTDIVTVARAEGHKIAFVEAPFPECMGINSRAELALAEAAAQAALRTAALEAGATMPAPDTVFFSADTNLAADVTIAPYVVFGPGVTVKAGAEIKSFSHLEGCIIRERAIIGPHARLRPGADIGEGSHIGNFVEIKAATIGPGAKANHLSYIGDAEIGAGTNIGAGTITCNYDGKTKHKTKIGENAFVGSNTALVAPVTIGDAATIAAGSTITENVPPNTLAIGRGRQVSKAKR